MKISPSLLSPFTVIKKSTYIAPYEIIDVFNRALVVLQVYEILASAPSVEHASDDLSYMNNKVQRKLSYLRDNWMHTLESVGGGEWIQ